MPQNPLGTVYGQNGAGSLVPVATNFAHEMHVATGGRSSNLFMAANSAGVTTSAALATTYVGICLSNPAGNASGGTPIYFNVRRVSGMTIVAPAALLGFNLITGYAAGGVTAHTTPLTPFSAIIGGSATATAKVDSACTLVGTPAWTMPLVEGLVSANLMSFNLDLNGGIVIPPGGYIAIGSTIAGPAAGFLGGFSWEEVVTK